MVKVILRKRCKCNEEAESLLVSQEDWDANESGSKATLDAFAWEAAVEFAESFGIYQPEDNDDEDNDDDDNDNFNEQVEGWFEIYQPDEHDNLMAFGQKEWRWRVFK